MVKDFLAGNSLHSIAKRFNDEGVKTFRRGFEWDANSCRAILRNTVLIGEFLGNKKFCEPIISREDFDTIKARLAKNVWGRKGREGENLVNIFRGLAFCSECGKTMHQAYMKICSRTQKPYAQPYRYLRCPSSTRGQHCSNRQYMKALEVEAEFFVNFLMKSNPPEVMLREPR
jgi:Recombinase/Recombinase zinc beta ribbon domain